METEVINTLANSTNVVILILLASGPLFGAGIIFVVYRLINKFGDKFIKAMDDIVDQVKQTKELISSLYKDVDWLKEEV